MRIRRGLLGIAVDDMVDLARFDAGALDGFLAGNGAEFHSGEVAQLLAITPHGRTRTGDDGNVRWLQHSLINPLGMMAALRRVERAQANYVVYQRRRVMTAQQATPLRN